MNRKSTASSGNAGSGSVKSNVFNEQQMRIFDEDGNDLTPVPMIFEDKRLRQMEKENTLDPTVLQVSSLSYVGQAFSRSLQSVSNPYSETTSEMTDSHATKHESVADDHSLKEVEEESPEEIDLDEEIYITVTESETLWLFDQQPSIMSRDDEWVAYQTQRNNDYKAVRAHPVLCASRMGNDRYVERGMNTMPKATIVKMMQTLPIEFADKTVNSTVCDLWDAAQQLAEKTEEDPQMSPEKELSALVEADDNKLKKADVPTAIPRSLIDKSKPPQLTTGLMEGANPSAYSGNVMSTATIEAASVRSVSGENSTAGPNSTEHTKSPGFDNPNLVLLMKNVEKALNLNCYYEKYLQYKSIILRRLLEDSSGASDNSESDTIAMLSHSTSKPSRISAMRFAANDEGAQRVSERQTVHVRQSAIAGEGVGGQTAEARDKSTPTGGAGAATTTDGSKTSGGNTDAEGGVAQAHGSGNPSIVAKKASNGSKPAPGSPVNLQMKVASTAYMPPDLYLLWKFGCQLTKGRNVTSIAFNPKNKDILAVGYGAFEFDRQHSGLVCCWSIKKINYPERSFKTPSGVTAIAWSTRNENLLAVGTFSGVIMVFDARKGNKIPIIDTTHAAGRHYGPICKLEWVSREAGRSAGNMESLISLSMDGRVTEWFTLKGFDCTDLMVLKRPRKKPPNPIMKKKHTEPLIVRHAVGTALCFTDDEQNIYFIGTEDGQIHKCSCSYNEQYLETYNGHTASVYAIKCSPFIPDVFLSCSADWTIRLWHADREKSYLTMATHSSAVNDLAWSHQHGAVFACTNESFLEIWDLEHSTLDPVHVETVCVDTTMSVVLFTEESDVSR
ncbi:unnamed protein product [Mesocestoides corti]|uniref:Dynein axonemal intermediate chain 4 n=1 Tax=Mesocestoides corti TaxID=53468 RepID=A0A158QU22_MESCO|nr:unnamed protein product [Mesocestoides corti]